jgi:hypothetical protein
MLDWLKGAALVAFISLCLTVMVDYHRTSKHLNALLMASTDTVEITKVQIPLVQQDIHATAQTLSATAQATTTTLNQVQAELKPLVRLANLDLQETHRVLLEAGLTAMEARKASAEERAALPGLTAKFNTSFDALNADLVSLNDFIQSGRKLVDDPNLKSLIVHADGTVGHLEGITADGEKMTHHWANPTKKQVFWGYVETFGIVAAKIFAP